MHTDRQHLNVNFPQPSDLFNGDVDQRLAAAAASRYHRVGRAIQFFFRNSGEDSAPEKRRRRWRIGLHAEIVCRNGFT